MKAVAVIFKQNQISTHPERATGRQVAAQVTSGGTSWRGRGFEVSSETSSSIFQHPQGLRAAGVEQPQQPGRAALCRGGALPMAPWRLCCVRRGRQAGKMEKRGVSKVAKEQEMHLRLCQISAT